MKIADKLRKIAKQVSSFFSNRPFRVRPQDPTSIPILSTHTFISIKSPEDNKLYAGWKTEKGPGTTIEVWRVTATSAVQT